jgi:hypothetical protein
MLNAEPSSFIPAEEVTNKVANMMIPYYLRNLSLHPLELIEPNRNYYNYRF